MVAPVLRVAAPRVLSDLLKFEVDPDYVREIATLAASNPVVLGTPVAAITLGAVTSAAKAGGNTGNGTLALDGATPKIANALAGVYSVRFTSATAYRVTDPRGLVLGDGANGSAFADRIKFTTTAGGTAFVAGDGFDVTIAAGSGKIVVLNPAALDGSAKCAGLSLFNRDPGLSDLLKGITYLARGPATVADFGIQWPVGFTDPQKAAAVADLTALGIVVRPAF